MNIRLSSMAASIILIIVLVGCGGPPATDAPPEPPAEPAVVVDPTDVPAPTEAPPPADPTEVPSPTDAPPPDDAQNPAVLDLDDETLYAAPEGLNYLTTLDFRMLETGTDTVIGSIVGGGRFAREPESMALAFDADGAADLGGQKHFEMAEIEDMTYLYGPATGCFSFSGPSGPENPFAVLLDAGGLLGGDAQLVASDVEVNGLLTNQYALTMDNVDQTDPTAPDVRSVADGSNLYVAIEGDFVVRVVLVGTGVSSLLAGDPTIEGDIFYQLDYTPVLSVDEVLPPEGCAAG